MWPVVEGVFAQEPLASILHRHEPHDLLMRRPRPDHLRAGRQHDFTARRIERHIRWRLRCARLKIRRPASPPAYRSCMNLT